MGFQNKWIGFLNLSKYRTRGLFWTWEACSEQRFRVHCLGDGEAESQFISNLLFLMEAEASRTKKWAQGGQTNLNMMSPGAIKASVVLHSLRGKPKPLLAETAGPSLGRVHTEWSKQHRDTNVHGRWRSAGLAMKRWAALSLIRAWMLDQLGFVPQI